MTRRLPFRWWFGVWVAALLWGAAHVAAEEVIVFWQKTKSPTDSVISSPALESLRGQLLGLDDNRCVLQMAGQEQPLTLPSMQVAGIKVLWDDETMHQVNSALRIGNDGEAVAKLQTIIDQADAQPWKQKLLLLEIAAAATRIEKLRVATRVCSLVQSSKAPLFALAYAPIQWTSDPVAREVVSELSGFADDPSTMVQIVVCSWNLSSSDQQAYIKKLEAISQNSKDELSLYAKAQLWRTIPPKEFVESRLQDALRIRDSLPYCLQAGPTAVIADRVERSGNYELAYELWLEAIVMTSNRGLPLVRTAVRHLDLLAAQPGIGTGWESLKQNLLQLGPSK